MRWSRLLLLAVLVLLPSCGIFGRSGPSLPPEMPPNFFLGMRVLEQRDPPIDYQIKIERTGEVQYETTIRSPRRRSFQGQFELSESQMVRLYDAVLASEYDGLASAYTAEVGSSTRRENGERIFYVVAGDVDKRIDANYTTVPALDELQRAIVAEMPGYVLTGDGGPGSVMDRPEAFVGSKVTMRFHHPECELCDDLAPGDRDSYTNEYDALNFGYHPCEVCRPLETRR